MKGDKNKPEPISFRVTFPGGDVDIIHTTEGYYWVHRENKMAKKIRVTLKVKKSEDVIYIDMKEWEQCLDDEERDELLVECAYNWAYNNNLSVSYKEIDDTYK